MSSVSNTFFGVQKSFRRFWIFFSVQYPLPPWLARAHIPIQFRARGIRTLTSQMPSSAASNILPAAIAADIRYSAAPIQYISWRLAPNAAFGGFSAGNAAFGGANRPKWRRVNYTINHGCSHLDLTKFSQTSKHEIKRSRTMIKKFHIIFSRNLKDWIEIPIILIESSRISVETSSM